jgi:hypothetical protein
MLSVMCVTCASQCLRASPHVPLLSPPCLARTDTSPCLCCVAAGCDMPHILGVIYLAFFVSCASQPLCDAPHAPVLSPPCLGLTPPPLSVFWTLPVLCCCWVLLLGVQPLSGLINAAFMLSGQARGRLDPVIDELAQQGCLVSRERCV